jgi:hypothetical protein
MFSVNPNEVTATVMTENISAKPAVVTPVENIELLAAHLARSH